MTIEATREYVIQCYRFILNREPENDLVIDQQLDGKPTLWEVIRRLVNSDERRIITQNNSPTSLHKCRSNTYLSRTMDATDRYSCFLTHYDHLKTNLTADNLDRILYRDATLHQWVSNDITYSITIQTSRFLISEGELSLYFRANGNSLYVISFTVVPGRIFGLKSEKTILISRMQGCGSGKLANIQIATKAMNDIAPQAILYAALEGIAEASNFTRLVGISGENHIAYRSDRAHILSKAYDHFFLSVDAVALEAGGYYLATVAAPLKSLSLIKPGHRIRTKIKREKKKEISAIACASWKGLQN